jgi:hydroxyacylglutathione hydrolase
MKLKTIKSEGIAHNSYFLSDGDEAVVIDPRRDSRALHNELLLLDVREPSEWKEGYIESAEYIFFGHLMGKRGSLPRNKPVAVICSVGQRSSIGASILKKEGFAEDYNVLGGMTAWTNLGYPTVK